MLMMGVDDLRAGLCVFFKLTKNTFGQINYTEFDFERMVKKKIDW